MKETKNGTEPWHPKLVSLALQILTSRPTENIQPLKPEIVYKQPLDQSKTRVFKD